MDILKRTMKIYETVEYDKLPGAKLKHFLWSDMNTLEPLGISRAYGE